MPPPVSSFSRSPLFQGGFGQGGTHNAIMSSSDYVSQGRRNFDNISDGFYISPAFLDKMTIHIAKNFMELPKIKARTCPPQRDMRSFLDKRGPSL